MKRISKCIYLVWGGHRRGYGAGKRQDQVCSEAFLNQNICRSLRRLSLVVTGRSSSAARSSGRTGGRSKSWYGSGWVLEWPACSAEACSCSSDVSIPVWVLQLIIAAEVALSMEVTSAACLPSLAFTPLLSVLRAFILCSAASSRAPCSLGCSRAISGLIMLCVPTSLPSLFLWVQLPALRLILFLFLPPSFAPTMTTGAKLPWNWTFSAYLKDVFKPSLACWFIWRFSNFLIGEQIPACSSRCASLPPGF